jgi:Flp pilus assembly protein TadG
MAMRQTRFTRARQERGVAIIEAAITLPLLLLLSVGVFEFGRAFQHWQVLTNSAREGARVAVLPGSTDQAVRTRVQNYLTAGGVPAPVAPATVGIAVNRNAQLPIGAGTAAASTVTVSYPFQFIVLQPVAELVVSGSTVGEPLTMTASSTMRNE